VLNSPPLPIASTDTGSLFLHTVHFIRVVIICVKLVFKVLTEQGQIPEAFEELLIECFQLLLTIAAISNKYSKVIQILILKNGLSEQKRVSIHSSGNLIAP